MNNKFVIAALLGALTADQVMAARVEDDSNLLELEDDDAFAPEDFQELEADVDSFAPKKPAAKAAAPAKKAKADSSDDESTSDDERHEAYKVGDRNTAQSKLAK
jgi:NADH dehydrogenase [ubiquinone] 1 alpha subcomplex assembly factor 7